ncbi:hypothetical protein Leryth_007347 [Lithospermum erythrorhizon]|nr:hypothetical protein Leryth_007347 [Lithospermum erythrorhizon]
MVVEEKILVKQLQLKVAKLEAELQSPDPSASSSLKTLLMEKELKIKKMEREMNEIKRQRDIAQSQLEQEISARKEMKTSNQDGPSRQLIKCISFEDNGSLSSSTPLSRTRARNGLTRMVRHSIKAADPSIIVHEIRKMEMRQRQLGDEANRALELLHKEVVSSKLGSQGTAETIANLLSEIKGMHTMTSAPEEIDLKDKASLGEEIERLNSQESNITTLEQKLENVQRTIEKLSTHLPSDEGAPDIRSSSKKKKTLPFALSNTPNMQHIIRSPCSTKNSCETMLYDSENTTPENDLSSSDGATLRQKGTPSSSETNHTSSRKTAPAPKQGSSVNVKKMQAMFQKAAEENIRSIKAYVTELKERVAKLQYQKQLLVCQVLEMEANDTASDETNNSVDQSPMSWHLVFEEQRKQIIMLWYFCHVSIVHRSQFYLLFRGDPSDQIYMEVELKRLTWLEQQFAEVGNASPALLGDDPPGSVAASVRALKQEREHLAKRVSTKLSAEERELLYLKWDIPLEGKLKRRLQLVNKLWTDPLNMQHVQESAEIVAKLVGFCENGEHVSKEMFQLNFVCPNDKKSWMGWNLISNILHL